MPKVIRRPWLAAFLSLICGPLGHLYAGAAKRAIGVFALGMAITLVAFFLAPRLPSHIACYSLFAIAIGLPLFYVVDAFRTATKNRVLESRKFYQRWWVYLMACVFFILANVAVALIGKTFLAEAFIVPTGGMSDTLLPGDRILVDKLFLTLDTVQQGDVVVFFSEGKGSSLWVQRAVGLPGDKIEVRDETVLRNGEVVEETYVRLVGPKPPIPELLNMPETAVPAGQLFLLGDNRRRSKDSRMIGCVPVADVIGSPCFIYWSTDFQSQRQVGFESKSAPSTRWERIGRDVRR